MFLTKLLGRKRSWQLGRRLYMTARGENPNQIEANGETTLARALIDQFSEDRPMIVWDVGANIGDYTAMVLDQARAAQKDCRLELFEPSAKSADALEARFANDDRVRIHRMALSSQPGMMKFEMHGETAGTSTLQLTGRPDAQIIDVDVDTVERRAHTLQTTEIDLLKIDAEGHDLEVIKGAKTLIAEQRIKVLQFEYNYRWIYGRNFLKDVFEIAEECDYEIGMISPSGLTIYRDWNAENERFFEANYAIVRKDVLARLPHERTRWAISNTIESVA